jgi:hypothetical protein
MRHLLEASLLVCALALALPAAAQDEGPGVPVDQAAYHVPVFRNDYVALLRVNIPSQRSAGYHIHSADQISILIEEADQAGQVLGQAPTPPRRNPRGSVTYTAYSKKAMTHRVNNVGPTAFHNIVVTLLDAQPGRFSPGLREGVGYTQFIDNERVRAWRLVLEPGQAAAAITQKAPAFGSSSTAAKSPRAFPVRPIAAWPCDSAISIGRSRVAHAPSAISAQPASSWWNLN